MESNLTFPPTYAFLEVLKLTIDWRVTYTMKDGQSFTPNNNTNRPLFLASLKSINWLRCVRIFVDQTGHDVASIWMYDSCVNVLLDACELYFRRNELFWWQPARRPWISRLKIVCKRDFSYSRKPLAIIPAWIVIFGRLMIFSRMRCSGLDHNEAITDCFCSITRAQNIITTSVSKDLHVLYNSPIENVASIWSIWWRS